MRSPVRLAAVDRLRGFALLGIVLVNAPFLVSSIDGTLQALDTPADRAAAFVVWAFFQGKSYVVFAFLFGYSLTLLLASLERRGLPVRRVLLQRLAALALLGVAHAILLFPGDVLAVYALLGIPLLWLHGASTRTLRRVAIGGWLVQLPGLALLAWAIALPDDGSATAEIDRGLASASVVEGIATRLELWPAVFVFQLLLQGGLVVGVFALGILVGRRGILRDVAANRPLLRRVRRLGWLLGLPPQLAAATLAVAGGRGSWQQGVALLVSYPTAPVLAAGYIATIVLLPLGGLAAAAEHEGQMSLSVYLMESVLLCIAASGWGLGLFGLGIAATTAVALAVWILLAAGSRIWGDGIGQGPFERLLRRLTYVGQRHRERATAGAG